MTTLELKNMLSDYANIVKRNDESVICLEEVGLSENPSTAKTPDSMYNLTSDGRKFFMARYYDPQNPMGGLKSRMISEQETGVDADGNATFGWAKKIDRKFLEKFQGMNMRGQIVTVAVPPYKIAKVDGTFNEAKSITIMVFPHEDVLSILTQDMKGKYDVVTKAGVNPAAINTAAFAPTVAAEPTAF